MAASQQEVDLIHRRHSRYVPSRIGFGSMFADPNHELAFSPSAEIHLAPVASGKYLDWGSFDLQNSPPYWRVKHSKSSSNLIKAKQAIRERGSEDIMSNEEIHNDEYNDDLEFLADLNDQKETLRASKGAADVDNDQKPYCLVFYGLRGDAELIRLIFITVGAQYDERQIGDEEDRGQVLDATPYRALPVITKGTNVWGCTEAIVRTLARKYHLMGLTNHEHLVVEAMFERLCQLKRSHTSVIQTLHHEIKGKERMEWIYHQLRYVILPPAMAEWEKLILASKGPFIVASGMSLADLAIMDFLDQCSLKISLDDVMTDFDAVADLVMLVKGHQRIATYLDERPDLDWNI